MRIVGLDLSWSETGIAGFVDGEYVTSTIIRTKPDEADMPRVARIVGAIQEFIGPSEALVAIEGYSYGALAGRERMGELGGIVRWALWMDDVDYVAYPVSTWRKALLGTGAGDKPTVAMKLAQRYNWPINNVNALEAAAVAYCAHLHRQPADTWTVAQAQAFAIKKPRRRAA